jgi:hypothetical protein
MAQPVPPLPARARAVIVALESYELAGDSAAKPGPTPLDTIERITPLTGALSDALLLAKSLCDDLGFVPADIDFWSSPKPAVQDWPSARSFTRDAFEIYLTETLAADKLGGTLLLFWTGHGVIDRDNRLQLLLPGSTITRPRSFDVENLTAALQGLNLAQFSHQVLVWNACRVPALDANLRGHLNRTSVPTENPVPAMQVQQLRVYGASLGQAAWVSQLPRALCAAWRGLGRTPWPDLEQIAQIAAESVEQATDESQSPRVVGWSGSVVVETARPPLATLLGALNWTTSDFLALALRCLRPSDRRQSFADLPAIVEVLDDLAPDQGVEPLHEFVARVLDRAGAAAPVALHGWYQRETNAQQRADVAARLATEGALTVLQLWVDDALPAVRAALIGAEGGVLRTDWDIRSDQVPFISGDRASLAAAIGCWLGRALGCVQLPLVLELFMPLAMLAEQLDACKVAADGDDWQLGPELPALLRSLERHKSRKKREAWLQKARQILGRRGEVTVLLHWCGDPPDADSLRSAFAEGAADGAIWLGLAQPPTAANGNAFDAGLVAGVPAMLWLRDPHHAQAPQRATLEQCLVALLNTSVQRVPLGLRAWREQHAHTLRTEPALLLDDPARPPPWTQAFGRG